MKNVTQNISKTMGLLHKFQPILPRPALSPCIKHSEEMSSTTVISSMTKHITPLL